MQTRIAPGSPVAGALAGAVCLLLFAVAGRAATDVVIDDVEPLRQFVIDRSPATAARKPSGGTTRGVAFRAYGREFAFDLQPSHRLLAGLAAARSSLAAGAEILTGRDPAMPGSWARLGIVRGSPTGAVWDGTELYLVDRADRFPGIAARVADAGALVMVRVRDIHFVIDGESGSRTGKSAAAMLQESTAAARRQQSVVLPMQAITLGLVLDAAYHDRFDEDAVTMALVMANVADGIFSEQANIHIELEQIESFTAEPDPFTTTDPNDLLAEVTDFRASRPDLAAHGLTHLVTNVDLDGTVRGIAQVASMCDLRSGTGLTQAEGSALDSLVLAHEFGHNLGARHDGEAGSPCADTREGFLMSAELNYSGELSQCSLQHIADALEQATCLTSVSQSEIELETGSVPATVYYNEPASLSFLVNNIGQESTFDGRFDVGSNDALMFELHGATGRECLVLGASADQSCPLGNLYSGETVTVEVAVIPDAVGELAVQAAVAASNDTDLSNNGAVVTVDVQPAAAVQLGGQPAVPGSENIKAGESVAFTVTAANTGDFDTLVAVTLSAPSESTLATADNCAVPFPNRLECDLGVVPAGSSRSLGFDAHPDAALAPEAWEFLSHSVRAELYTGLYNLDPHHTTADLRYVVWGAFRDMQTGFAVEPQSLEVGQSGEFTAYVRNAGPDPITEVTFRAGVSGGVTLADGETDQGVCPADGDWVVCIPGQLDAGEEAAVSIPYSADAEGSATIVLAPDSFGGHELDPDTTRAQVTFDVVAQSPPPTSPPPPNPPTTSGGGGGIVLPAWLLIAAIARFAAGVARGARSATRRLRPGGEVRRIG